MRAPCALRRAPPELPGFIGASVWISPLRARPLGAVLLRFSPEMIPDLRGAGVGVPLRPVRSHHGRGSDQGVAAALRNVIGSLSGWDAELNATARPAG